MSIARIQIVNTRYNRVHSIKILSYRLFNRLIFKGGDTSLVFVREKQPRCSEVRKLIP